MWEKGFRTVTFAAIYDVIYWGEKFDIQVIDIEAISQSYSAEITPEQKELILALVMKFVAEQGEIYQKIEEHTTSWAKTYDLIKAIMSTYDWR
jgi:hypothetical protein